MFVDMSLKEFIDKLGSDEPVPGGGSVAALCASLSSALIEMVLKITKKKEGTSDKGSQISALIEKGMHLKREFLIYTEKDADAFAEVINAYRLPKNTESEKKLRLEAIERALKEAALIPMEVAEKAFKLFELSLYLVQYGNRNAITDSAVSAIVARSAVISALYNVRINLLSIKDEAFKKEMLEKAAYLEEESIKQEKEILDMVNRILAGEG